MRSEAGLARQGKLKHHDGSGGECNGCENKCQGIALESSQQDLRTCVPQAILEDSTFTIKIINVTLYYSATLASVFASSARRAVCIIREILVLYSENAAEMISEGLKSKFFWGHSRRLPLCARYALLEPSPVNFCVHSCSGRSIDICRTSKRTY